jgi:hypothetical protein
MVCACREREEWVTRLTELLAEDAVLMCADMDHALLPYVTNLCNLLSLSHLVMFSKVKKSC